MHAFSSQCAPRLVPGHPYAQAHGTAIWNRWCSASRASLQQTSVTRKTRQPFSPRRSELNFCCSHSTRHMFGRGLMHCRCFTSAPRLLPRIVLAGRDGTKACGARSEVGGQWNDGAHRLLRDVCPRPCPTHPTCVTPHCFICTCETLVDHLSSVGATRLPREQRGQCHPIRASSRALELVLDLANDGQVACRSTKTVSVAARVQEQLYIF